MSFLNDKCVFQALDLETIKSCDTFSCGNDDLDEFFNKDAHYYSAQLLGKSYCFRLKENLNIIICAFTVSNSGIRVDDMPSNERDNIRKIIPEEKHLRNYPAVLIGRLGVNIEYQRNKIGGELMNFIKAWFIDPHNKTGCRFITVDAYNNPDTIHYYQNNGFEFTFPNIKTEKEYYSIKSRKLKTRTMFFDLIKITQQL